MDDILRSTLTHRHLHSVQNQLCPQVVGHRPADDLAAPGIQHHGKVEEACRRRHVGDVGDPELVRPGRGELAIHQVRRRPGVLVTPGRHRAAVPMAGANQASLPHQPRNPFAAVLLAIPLQLGVDTRCPIDLA